MTDGTSTDKEARRSRTLLRKALKLWGYPPGVVQIVAGSVPGVQSTAQQSVVVRLTPEHAEVISEIIRDLQLPRTRRAHPDTAGCAHPGTLEKREGDRYCRRCNQLIYLCPRDRA